MKKHEVVLIIGACLLLLSVVICMLDFDGRVEWVSEYYDLYHVDAPFGTFWVDVEGRFVFGCGKITSEFVESYTAKYFKDGQVLTIHMDAEEVPVMPDGTFRLEIKKRYFWARRWWESESYLVRWKEYRVTTTHYIIHVPALPSVNQTTQWEIIR